MAKRKKPQKDHAEKEQEFDESSSAESSSEDDTDMLDVEFEWFDPQPEHDFHGLKILLRQLFDVDAQGFDLSPLADLILSQPLLGSTVKVEGNESDPYAFLTVLNLHEHRERPIIQGLTEYIVKQANANISLAPLKALLDSGSSARVGLILTERLINVPPQVVPPMYKMLLEEITWAIEEKEPYQFSHYLIFSKTYAEISSSLDLAMGAPQKKKKKQQKLGAAPDEATSLFYFHAEDEVLERHASIHGSFDYLKKDEGQSDSKRAFQDLGIKPCGHIMVIEAPRFEAVVKAVEDFIQQT